MELRDSLRAALKGHNADYIEIRTEEAEGTHIQFRGVELESIGRSSSLGGNVRALVKGGWGFASFNDTDNLKEKVARAVSQARLAGSGKSSLAPVEPVEDVVGVEVQSDPVHVSLAEKKGLMEQYAQEMLSIPGIQTCFVSYGDGRRRVSLATSEGTYIEQPKVDISLRLTALARDGGEVQQCGLSLGSRGNYGLVEGLHQQARECAEKAVAMLRAPQVRGGEYTVVLDPVLAGVFIHEAFGHLSESDFLYENDRMREIMVLGRRFGGRHLNVVDGAALPGLRGSFKYDDEGVPASKTYLIREGVLVGRLHSRETASKMGEKPTGNARAIAYAYPPIVRMTNTYIEAGEASLEDLLSDIKEGVYAKNWYGGMTSMEMFTFSAGEAYMIRNGKIAEPLRPVMLSGNLFATLENLDAIADDLSFNQGGGCGKGGQSPLPVADGSPHIRIRKCLLGGK